MFFVGVFFFGNIFKYIFCLKYNVLVIILFSDYQIKKDIYFTFLLNEILLND